MKRRKTIDSEFDIYDAKNNVVKRERDGIGCIFKILKVIDKCRRGVYI